MKGRGRRDTKQVARDGASSSAMTGKRSVPSGSIIECVAVEAQLRGKNISRGRGGGGA